MPGAGATVIGPCEGFGAIDFAGLWRFRDLGRALFWRDVQVRYKQTLLGAVWAVLQPLAMMVVASLVLGKMLGLSARVEGAYPVFVYAGLLPWTLFSATVGAASGSLVGNAEMLRKVYFPRLLLPVSSVGAPLVDFAASLVVLVGLAMWFGVGLGWSLLLVPLLTVSVVLASLAVGVMLSAVTVSYRDFRLVVPFLLQLWFFCTPVVYPMPVGEWGWLLYLNPMHGTTEAFRAAVLGEAIPVAGWIASSAVAGLGVVLGVVMFARAEGKFADVV